MERISGALEVQNSSKSCCHYSTYNAVPDDVNVEEVLVYSSRPAIQLFPEMLYIQILSLQREISGCTLFGGTF